MINLPLNYLWLPILALIPIGIAVYKAKNKKRKEAWINFIIGAFVLLLSINDSANDKHDKKANADSLSAVHSQIIILGDTIHDMRDYLLKVGLSIDLKTGQLLIIDSQLLKRRFTQIINNYTTILPSGNEQRLTKAFDDLSNTDYTKRQIAFRYITDNFPDTLTENQIKTLISIIPSMGGSNLEMNDLLKTQKKSIYLEAYFKKIISSDNNNFDRNAWDYLLREDVNIDLPYVISIIKDKPNHCIKYENIVQNAMDMNNSHICEGLLNSHDLINFLINLPDERVYLQQSYNWISKMIDRKPAYNKYRNTYFFRKVKP